MYIGGISHRSVADHFRVTIPSLYNWCSVFVKRGMLLYHRYTCKQLSTFLVWLIFAAPYQTNRKWNLKLCTKKISFRSQTHTVRQKLSTTWLVSIISFLIMNLFQIGLLFSLPVHTYLLTCETGYWYFCLTV
jgi:hypothetical protein